MTTLENVKLLEALRVHRQKLNGAKYDTDSFLFYLSPFALYAVGTGHEI